MAARLFPGGARRAAGNSRSATSEQSATPRSKACPDQPDHRFPKSKRLLKSKDFREVYQSGTRRSGPYFSVICLRRPASDGPRIGFTVPRKLGKSVVRNRLRRRLRESIRMELGKLPPGWDLVFHPRLSALSAPLAGLRREVERIFLACERL